MNNETGKYFWLFVFCHLVGALLQQIEPDGLNAVFGRFKYAELHLHDFNPFAQIGNTLVVMNDQSSQCFVFFRFGEI